MPPVSFDPDSFQEGGGLWNDLNIRFTGVKFQSEWDYGGKSQTKTPALVSTLINVDTGEEVQEQGWSVGSANDYAASVDGVNPAAEGDLLMGPALRKGSNVVFLINSIIAAIPQDKRAEYMEKMLSGKASSLEGLEAHMVRMTVTRPGIQKKTRADGKTYEDTVPVVDKILKYPWEVKKAVPGAKAAGKPGVPAGKPAGKPAAGPAAGAPAAKATPANKPATAPAAAPGAIDYDAKTVEQILSVLNDAPDGISREDLCTTNLYEMNKVPKVRNEVIQRAYDPNWLTAQAEAGVGFAYDGESDTIYIAG